MKSRVLTFLILLSGSCMPAACALFQKTTKSSVSDVKERSKLAERSSIAEKANGKYSELFTFRKDGSIYQYQYVKDTSNEVRLRAVKVIEKQRDAQLETEKKTEPPRLLIFTVLALLLGLAILAVAEIAVASRRNIGNVLFR